MILFQKIKEAPKPMRAQMLTWVVAVLFAGALAYFFDANDPTKLQPTDDSGSAANLTAATFIPAGYVLVPIEVANFQSLDSILGQQGVVDLFRPSDSPSGKPIKVAERVRILRAPLNPSHFAVLAPDSESAALVSYPGAFTVVVQNPNERGTRFVNSKISERPRRASRIVVEVKSGT